MKKLFWFISAGMLAVVSTVFAGGGTVSNTVSSTMGTVKRMRIAWTSATNDATGTIGYLNGEIKRVTFVPTAGNTNNATITLTDINGIDLLAGLGSTVTSNAVKTVVPTVGTVAVGGLTTNVSPMVVDGAVSVIVTNCGVGGGYFDIYYYGPR